MTDNKKFMILLTCCFSSFLTPFTGSSINIALPSISKEFSMNAMLLSWVPTSYNLAAAMFLVPLGRLVDIYGREKYYKSGIIVYTVFSLLSAVAGSPVALIIYRVFQGLGGAMIFGTSNAILTSSFPKEERGKILGINLSAVYLGSSLGPILGGFLTYSLGWRHIFTANVLVGVAAAIIAFTAMRDKEEAKPEKFDLAGSVSYCIALIFIMYGFSVLPSMQGWSLVVLGALGLAFFGFIEMRHKQPVLDIKLFRSNTVFILSNLAAFINYSATFVVGFLLSLYLQYIKGMSPQQAGLVLVAQPVLMAVFTSYAGRLSDRIEPGIIASAGMALTTAGLFMLAFLGNNSPLWFIIAALILIGFGFAFFSSPNTNAIMSSVDRQYYGIASAFVGTMRLTGQMMSFGIIMIIFSFMIGKAKITPEYYGQFLQSAKTGFLVFGILCFIGIAASLFRGKVRKQEV